eukprot:141465_1
MSLCWIWLIYFISLFRSNVSVIYKGSRRIYTETIAAPSCTDHITTTFTFDDAKSHEVSIKIESSTNTSWFAIGFPNKDNFYYDKTKRKSTIMSGYAIVYINDNVQEYNIAPSGDNLIDSMTLQGIQNLVIDNIDNSGGTVTIDIRRNLTTADAEDFEFKFIEYTNCYPFLLTVGIGNGLTFTPNTNTHGSSYVYIYDKNLELDTTPYIQTWNEILGRADIPNSVKYFNITFSMDPTKGVSGEVDITVTDGKTDPPEARAWGLSFPDLADTAYYHPANLDPINMESGYSMVWAVTNITNDFTCVFGTAVLTEARLPMDGHACNKTLPDKTGVGTPFTNCWDELPVQNAVLNNYTDLSGVQTFSVTIPFMNCGYEFNPYEYKTCRPFTIVSMATNNVQQCMQNAVNGADGVPPISHLTNKIQIDDFPTRHPTTAPTLNPTNNPTNNPTKTP